MNPTYPFPEARGEPPTSEIQLWSEIHTLQTAFNQISKEVKYVKKTKI